MAMTKEEFKVRCESNDEGGGITYEDIARCAIEWGITSSPRAKPMHLVRYLVLKAAQTIDAEDFLPEEE